MDNSQKRSNINKGKKRALCGTKPGPIKTSNHLLSLELSERANERMSAAGHAGKVSRVEQAKK